MAEKKLEILAKKYRGETSTVTTRLSVELIEVVGRITGIAILVMLVWYIQIWPHHIYKVECNYLEDNVFTKETEYKIKKYDKKYISDGKDKEVLDLGEGKMSYHHFYLAILVIW